MLNIRADGVANPFKSIMNIKKGEYTFAFIMFAYFFLVITSFWILKPIKVGIFFSFYETHQGIDLLSWHFQSAQAEQIAKILNMVVAFIGVTVFTWLVRRFHRQQLTYVFSIFLMICFAAYSILFSTAPTHLTVWTFYLFGDLYNTLMVATFFAFLNDSVNSSVAKRLYGLIGLGGVFGGVFGSTFVRVWVQSISDSLWMWICFAITGVVILIARKAGKIVDKQKEQEIPEPSPPPQKAQKTKSGNPAFEGARLVFINPYLLAIVVIVGTYEIVSTVMDFQFKASVPHFIGNVYKNSMYDAEAELQAEYGDRFTESIDEEFTFSDEAHSLFLNSLSQLSPDGTVESITQTCISADGVIHTRESYEKCYAIKSQLIRSHFATIFSFTNWISMFVQFFLTSYIMRRFGLTTALLVLPIACVVGSLGFMAAPLLLTGSLLNTADNGFSYSINQSAKETLYVPTTKDEKYKAKAFIDMFVQRFAKALAVGVNLTITTLFVHFSSIRYLSLFTIAMIVIWIIAARYAGKTFHRISQ